jgi:hypothetical protein
MAAPTFVQATAGVTDAGGAWIVSGGIQNAAAAGNIAIAQILQDGATAGAVAMTAGQNIETLDGTDNTWTFIGTFAVGGSSQALQHLWIGRTLNATNAIRIEGTNSTSEDIYGRIYEFSGVNTGTTLADVIENGTAGSTVNSAGTSATIADADVTTLGADRLALNFVAGNDDNALDAFTGMSGGTWAEAAAEYAEASGTDGVIQLQIATIASAGTIGGGTAGWADATDSWGVVGFALKPAVAAAPASLLYRPRPMIRNI